jgi:2-haloacid dehalogenase
MRLDFKGIGYLTFDCYGTLIDWETGITHALQPILKRHGVSIADEALLTRYAAFEAEIEAGPYLPYRDVLKRIVDRFGQLLGFSPDETDRNAFSSSVAAWPAFPDSVDALKRLARTFKLVVLSNVDDDLFEGSNRRLGSPFHAVYTAQQIGSYKPDLRNFRYAIEKLGADKRQIVHVAQSPFHDIAPANELGLQSVWINRRHDAPGTGATPEATARPDLELRSLDALVAYVERRTMSDR